MDTQIMFNTMMSELKGINGRLDKIDERLDKMDERFDRMDERFDKMEQRQNQADQNLATILNAQTAMHQDLAQRISALAEKNRELETITKRNTYDITLLQEKQAI